MAAGAGTMYDRGDASDDIVLPFRTIRSNVMGRIVRLGASLDAILSRHAYPQPVSETLGEAVALTAMLGSTLKAEGGILGLQTRSDGPLALLVADYKAPGAVRGFASFEADRINALADASDGVPQQTLFGNGSLAMTIDPGYGLERYQGIVELAGQSLSQAAHTYFRQSEQLPTYVRLAVARHFVSDSNDGDGQWTWRAGGIMVQHLSREGGIPTGNRAESDREPMPVGEENEAWQRARTLASTVEDHELLDPSLSPERLLTRLFHEEGVRAFATQSIRDHCRCSRDRVESMLNGLGKEKLFDMREDDGNISVTCEFCSTKYRFSLHDIGQH